MKPMNRRQFLTRAAFGAGGLALAGCSSNPTISPTIASTPNTPPTTAPPKAAAVPATSIPVVQTPSKPPAAINPSPTDQNLKPTNPPSPASNASTTHVTVARGVQPEEMVRRAVKALGGMEKFVPRGARVIVKPNLGPGMLKPEFASMTNPFVVAAVVKLCLEAGASSVDVMDNSFGGRGSSHAYSVSGIEEQVKMAGGKMVQMAPFKYKETNLPQGKKLKKTNFYDEFLKPEIVMINVPIAKHHGSAGLTIGMKNLMGIIDDRNAVHGVGLAQGIADLNTFLKPKLTIVDAVRILLRNGPGGGNLNDVKTTNAILASTDIVAVDKFTTDNLFGLTTKDSNYPRYVDLAASMGLGNADLKTMKIEEIQVG